MGIRIKAGQNGLLPCPFCGGAATMYIDAQPRGGFVFVACDVCSSRSRAVWTNIRYGLPDEERLLRNEYCDGAFGRAINSWNNRTKG